MAQKSMSWDNEPNLLQSTSKCIQMNNNQCLLFTEERLMPEIFSFHSNLSVPLLAENGRNSIWNEHFFRIFSNKHELMSKNYENGLLIYQLPLNLSTNDNHSSIKCNVRTMNFNNFNWNYVENFEYIMKHENKIYFINHNNDFEIHEIENNNDSISIKSILINKSQWSSTRKDGACIKNKNNIYLFGGWYDEIQNQECKIISYIDILNMETNQWNKIENLNINVLEPKLLCFENKILIIGGNKDTINGDISLNTILIYSIKSKKMERSKVILPNNICGIDFEIAIEKYNDNLLIFGFVKQYEKQHNLNIPEYLKGIITKYYGVGYVHLFANKKHWKIAIEYILLNKT